MVAMPARPGLESVVRGSGTLGGASDLSGRSQLPFRSSRLPNSWDGSLHRQC